MDKSLLRRAELDTYDLHPLLREFGLDRLGDEREEVARRHGEYFVGRLVERHGRLEGSLEQIDIRDEVADDLPNLRPATLWAVDHLPTAGVVPVLNALNAFYFLHSWSEAIDHFEEIAAAVEDRLGPETAAADERYLWAKTLAMFNVAQFGDIERVRRELEPLLSRWERLGGVGLAACLLTLAIVADHAGEISEAKTLHEQAAEVGFGSNRLLELVALAWYGWEIFELGDTEGAEEIFHRGLSLAEEIHSYPGRAYLLSKLGVAADGLGNHAAAADYHQESREIFVKTGDLGGQGYTLSRLSWTYWLMGDFAKAKQYGEEGLEKFEEINHRWGVAASWCRIGLAELGLGNTAASAAAFRRGLDLAIENGLQTVGYYALMGMGRTYAAGDDLDRAARLLAHNVGLEQNPYVALACEALEGLGEAATAELRSSGAAMSLDEAIALARGA
jgi:tetratricopeptide (TPR) repeat protein